MNRRHLLGAFGLLLATLGFDASAAPSAVPTVAAPACDLSVQSADVAAARATLLAEPEPEDLQYDVSPGTKLALARYKDAVAALVAARFECAPPEQKPDGLAAALNGAGTTGVQYS